MSCIPNDDFLSLTRDNEWSLDAFSVANDHYTIEVWDTGVIFFNPKHSPAVQRHKAIVLSCAVHGNETAPIEILDRMASDILSNQLAPVHPVLFLFGNPAAINIGQRFVEENMNRLFSGHHSKGLDPQGRETNRERQRAKKLEEYVSRFFAKYPSAEKTHYDLHTAIRDSAHEKFAVYPFLHGKPWQKEQFEILRSMGVTTILLMKKPATTFSYYASRTHGAASFTIELGKVRPFGENDPAKFAAADKTLRQLVCGEEISGDGFDPKNFQILDVYRSINREHEDFHLNFADDVPNFTEFNQGDTLALENGAAIKAEKTGEAIVFPNAHVDIGQRALLTVIPTDVTQNLI